MVRRILEGYYRFLRVALATLMGLLVIPVTLQIIARYIGFIPRYIWTEEMARF
jgi:TRAP-type C4-dicarboxylate transport system permease small subunit